MNANQLKALVETADCGSFSAAARRLGVTQPAISLRLQTLERDLGVKLLMRQGETVTLTTAGRICYDVAVQILNLWDDATQRVAALRGQLSGRLVIGASTIPSEYILPSYLRRFREQHPLVALQLKVGSSQQMLSLLADGGADLCVVGSVPPGDHFTAFPVAADELTLIAPVGHPLAGMFVGAEELASQPLILREPGSGTRDASQTALAALGLTPDGLQVVGEVGSHEAVIAAVEAGLGLAIVSSLAAARAIADERVIGLNWPGATVRRSFYCVTRDGTANPAALALRDLLGNPPAPPE